MRELMGRRSCVATPQYITCTCDLQILVHMSSSAHVVRNSAHHVCFSVRINVCGHSLTTQTEEFRTSRSTGYIDASPPVSYGAITSICRHPTPVVGRSVHDITPGTDVLEGLRNRNQAFSAIYLFTDFVSVTIL